MQSRYDTDYLQSLITIVIARTAETWFGLDVPKVLHHTEAVILPQLVVLQELLIKCILSLPFNQSLCKVTM